MARAIRSTALAALLAALLGAALPAAARDPLPLDRELRPGAAEGCRMEAATPAAANAAAPHPARVRPPAEGHYVGLYQIPPEPVEIAAFADSIGGFPPIVFTFHDWYADTEYGDRPTRTFDDPMEGENGILPLMLAEWLREQGSVLAMAWAVYCCDIESPAFWRREVPPHDHFNRILAGADDAFIRDTARRLRDWGGPIMLTVVPEMNWQGQFAFGADGRTWMEDADDLCGHYGDPAWPDGPERIRDLFRRVIDLFREEGAHNVTWFMYSANQYMAPAVEGQSRWLDPRFYYPGDGYLDWVGQSVYFTDPAWGGDLPGTDGFERVFRPGYEAWRRVTDRPLLLAEFGMISVSEHDRRALWRRVFEEHLPSMPGVGAVTVADSALFAEYFDIPRLTARPAEAALLRRLIDDGGYARRLRLGR